MDEEKASYEGNISRRDEIRKQQISHLSLSFSLKSSSSNKRSGLRTNTRLAMIHISISGGTKDIVDVQPRMNDTKYQLEVVTLQTLQ